MDTPIRIVYEDPASGENRIVKARAGIPSLYSARDNRWFSTAFFLKQNGSTIAADGTIVTGEHVGDMVDWPEGATPFDHAIQRDFLIEDADGKAYVPDWIAALDAEAGARGRVVNAPSSAPILHVAARAEPPFTGNRKERRKQVALYQEALQMTLGSVSIFSPSL